jgi:hypothetical protein
MSKNTIQIEATPFLGHDGSIEVDVFFGRACEPSYTEKVTLIDLIDDNLESLIIPRTNKIAHYHTHDAKKFVKSLKRALKHAKKRVEELS